MVFGFGCNGSSGKARPVVCQCRVLMDGQVLHDVHVRLSEETEGQSLMDGTSDATGLIALKAVEGAVIPRDGSVRLKASVVSLGDWQVIAPWSSLEKTPLRVDFSPDVDTLQIELPARAIKSL
jgi:hypothetical protein